MINTIDKIIGGYIPNKDELVKILLAEDDVWGYAFKKAGELAGNFVYVRGIIEFSNYCSRRCKYCGLNLENKKTLRYRMTPKEIVTQAVLGYDAGYKTIVLQSGVDNYFTANILADIVKEIKKQRPVKITLSCGVMAKEELITIKKAGCDRYLLKHESSDEGLFRKLKPNSFLSDRINCLKTLKEFGFETGGGFMVGLPGQTIETTANDILTVASIPCDMAGIGPFISHPDTPLAGCLNGDVLLTQKCVALLRLMLPNINLPATTAISVLSEKDRNQMFSRGANVIMKKITPPNHAKNYTIYPSDKIYFSDDIKAERRKINDLLSSLGKTYD